MRPYFPRIRSFFKYLIFIPLFLMIFLNIQLISQIKDFNSLYAANNRNNVYNELGRKSDFNHVNSDIFFFNKYLRALFASGNLTSDQLSNLTLINPANDAPSPKESKKLEESEMLTQTTATNTPPSNMLELQELAQKLVHSNSIGAIRNVHFISQLLAEEARIDQTNAPAKNVSSSGNATTSSMPPPAAVYNSPKILVILVQVHSRISYLKALIESLKQTKYIEQTLVVFSHDLFDTEINNLIESINFCATLQIFYPFSLQLHPNTYPGQDPNDCPKSVSKQQALKQKCNNAAYPDSFGHYRESNVVQIKHHWFWKLNYVFEKHKETRNLKNLHILLLEEDYYMMPDSIHVLQKLTQKILSDIDVVSLGLFDKMEQNTEMKSLNLYAKAIWHTTNHNTGLLLSRVQWKMIKDCTNAFCTYDDYNWDWTLQYLSQTCFKLPLVSIHPVSPRVVHIGECGTHHKGSNCDPKNMVNSLKNVYESKKMDFFPKILTLNGINSGIVQIKKPNGGWSDPRDHRLCKDFVNPDTTTNTTIILKL